MGEKVDNLDLKIIHQLQKNGRISITELADNIHSSRPTITNRLKKLVDNDVVMVRGGLNITKFGFKMACIGLEVTDSTTLSELEAAMKCCPRVLNIYRTTDKANIHITIWGENDQTVNSTIESYRGIPNVNVIYAHYLGTPIHGDIMIDICSTTGDLLPCGKKDCNCPRLEAGWCMGCPASKSYQSPVLV